jgi:putative transposase
LQTAQHTSQTCHECGHIDSESRTKEKFVCTNCDHVTNADINAAKNILKRGIDLMQTDSLIEKNGIFITKSSAENKSKKKTKKTVASIAIDGTMDSSLSNQT